MALLTIWLHAATVIRERGTSLIALFSVKLCWLDINEKGHYDNNDLA